MEKEILYRLSYQARFNPCVHTNPFFNKPARKHLFTAPIKVVLADGVPLLAKAMLEVIDQEQNISLDGFEFDGPSLSDWYNGSNADVIVMDIFTPFPWGIAPVKQLLGRFPSAKVIVFSVEERGEIIKYMKDLGIYAYEVKTRDPNNIIQTIIKVHAGEKVFPENMALDLDQFVAIYNRFIDISTNTSAPTSINTLTSTSADTPTYPSTPQLTPREVQVLKLIEKGQTNPQIAVDLKISQLTVKKHRENLRCKLGASNTAQMIANARLKRIL